MGPLTMPSICKSSEPVTWPLIWMLAPRRAPPRAGVLPRRPDGGTLKGTTGDGEAGEGETAGGSATACCLDHIKPPLSEFLRMKCSGQEEQCEFNSVAGHLRRQHGKGMGLPSLETDPVDRGEPRLETIRG